MLRDLSTYQNLDTSSEPAFDTVCLAQSLFDVATSTVSLIDIERQWFKARSGLDVSATVNAEAFCSQAITGSDVLTILDAANDERFASNPLVTGVPYNTCRIRLVASKWSKSAVATGRQPPASRTAQIPDFIDRRSNRFPALPFRRSFASILKIGMHSSNTQNGGNSKKSAAATWDLSC
ncbi:hypothetical protein [Sphingomonas sp. PP-CE-1G-424]|uniref:hypothetical protein n=1 Tax=Sphingomonas sp. PP-CE-1G-424 TaxID=2135658 RepID=UPI001054C0A7|nr:hypothetical protein [Sphingomonas sp. PP-CE-1G-424]